MRKNFLHHRPTLAFGRICGMEQACRKVGLRELGLQRSLVFSDLVDPIPHDELGFFANQNIYINLRDVFR